ncbi:organic solute transporter subunit alpha [Elysia marginata]|uniref:Organic solute transporter subunit alpha n=1 Tax=Elysia marginata TaxID=1093978 RepID=A0AAV4FGP2_9GAST|nr:organic solute transporter subunit alpha [Elysia marginata]
MYKFVELATLFISHYDGLRERIKETQKLHFDVAPLACCCKCLPTANIKRHRVLILRGLVLQFPFISLPIAVLTMYLWVDGKYRTGEYTASNPWPYLTAVKVLSTLTAMYGLGVLFAMVKEPLKMTYISQKYMGLKLCALTFNIQHFVFRVLTSNDVFEPRKCFSRRAMGDFYENTAFNFELFAISLFNLWAYRKPFKQSESSADIEGSTFDQVMYSSSKDTGVSGAVLNHGFVEDNTVWKEEQDATQSTQPVTVVNNDTAGNANSNMERSDYGACNEVQLSNDAHTRSDASRNGSAKMCPKCGHDLLL